MHDNRARAALFGGCKGLKARNHLDRALWRRYDARMKIVADDPDRLGRRRSIDPVRRSGGRRYGGLGKDPTIDATRVCLALVALLAASQAGLADDCRALRQSHDRSQIWLGVLTYDDDSAGITRRSCFLSREACFSWLARTSGPAGHIHIGHCLYRGRPVSYRSYVHGLPQTSLDRPMGSRAARSPAAEILALQRSPPIPRRAPAESAKGAAQPGG